MTRQYLESVYSELCAKLGDLVYKIEQLEAERTAVKAELQDLNKSLAKYETLEKLVRSQGGQTNIQKEAVTKSSDVATGS